MSTDGRQDEVAEALGLGTSEALSMHRANDKWRADAEARRAERPAPTSDDRTELAVTIGQYSPGRLANFAAADALIAAGWHR